jgi:5-methylcytosine-specific restriction protein B
MSMDGKASFKVRELMETKTLKDFADLKNAQKVSSVIWAQLGSHTSPESKTVHYPTKREPFLFDKDEQSRWSLTTAGKEFVQDLTELLNLIRKANSVVAEASDFCEFVTFHQSFAYEEFIEGLKPLVNDDGELTYEVRPGVFKQIAARAEVAWKNHGESAPNYLLIIDEINRANIAKVFGELITLIEDDKRLGERNALELRLSYSGDKFGVPPNLYIVGTMNTADRSIALLDLALRRRFSFVEVTPDPSLLDSIAGINLAELLKKLNEKIELLLDRDHRIGHSYFMKATNASELHFAWYRRVLPLLQEYFYNDSERLYALLGDSFMKRIEIGSLSSELSELVDTDSPRYEIKMMSEAELLSALAGYR